MDKNAEKDKISVLYVDDEMNNLISFKATFRKKFDVHIANNADEAIQMLDNTLVHVIITDQRMPGKTGVEFLEYIIPRYPDPTRILLTAFTDISALIDAVNIGKIFSYHNKPWNESVLEKIINEAYDVYKNRIEQKEKIKELSISNEQFEFLLRQKLLS